MEHPFDRRTLLKVAAAAAAGVVATPSLSRAADGKTLVGRTVFRGEFTDPATPDWVYLPFQVPKGTTRLHVKYDYSPTSGPITTNVVDIGIFDASGHELGNDAGFRGWSGGARRRFSITPTRATPGYLAGPLTPGVWVVALGPYQINGAGTPYKVVVECELGEAGPDFVPHVAPQAVAGTGPGWYRGDLHTHTIYSDGRWTQPSLLTAARAAGLDFLGTSEHNTSAATYTWGRNVPEDFLVINGEEVTTRNGHWLATGLPPMTWIDWRYRAADDKIQAFADQVRELGGVTIAAHPSIPVPSIKWDFDADFAEMDAMEVWNGPWSIFNQQAVVRWDTLLKRGIYKPGVGNSDSHHDGQQVGLAHNVMRMATLSAAEMVMAVKGGHLWVTGDSGVDLTFTATRGAAVATCGETLAGASPEDPVTVDLVVTGVPLSVGQLIGPTGVLAGAIADGSGTVTISAELPSSALAYVRAEVRRPGTITTATADYAAAPMLALTNPVFVSVPPSP